MKRLAVAIAIISSISLHASAVASCKPNKKEFGGSKLLADNWKLLSKVGMTKELRAKGSPGACQSLQYFKTAPPYGAKGQVSETQRCLTVDDYGIGSFDALKSDYCKHDIYLLVLHEESGNVWRVYKLKGYVGATSGLAAEFDKGGKAVPISTAATDPSTTSSPPTAAGVSGSIQRGAKDLLKGLGK